MTVLEFLSQLRQQNIIIKLTPEGDQLKINAPKGALTNELKVLLKERKAEILSFLQEAQANKQADLPPINGVDRDGTLSLSYAQERIWKLQQLSPDAATMNIPVAWRLSGPLDASLLERALRRLTERHETIRSTFPVVDGQPTVHITDHLPLKLSIVDLRESPEAARPGEAIRVANTLAAEPFDIAAGPIMRATLIRTAPERHILLLVFHQIIFDWGAAVSIVHDLNAIYAALQTGSSPDLDPLAVQYVDFAQWQRDWLNGDVRAKQEQYWASQLKTPYRPFPLPADRPRPAVESFESGIQYFTISPALSAQVKTLSQKSGGTLYMTLLGSLQALLAGYSGYEDSIIFSLLGLNRPELKKLVGLFANPLPLRTDLSGNPTFSELFKRVQQTALGAYSNQDLPFERVIDQIQSENRTTQNGFFQVLFIYQHEPTPALDFAGVNSKLLTIGQHAPAFDLRFFAEESGDQIKGWLEYKTDLFDANTIEAFLAFYVAFLEAIVEQPDVAIADLLPLTAADKISAETLTAMESEEAATVYVAPRNELEEQLADIWARTFQMEKVGVHDNFFALGGHSLMAVTLFGDIKEKMGRELPLATLFEAPTIAGLAHVLDKKDWSLQWTSIVPIQPYGSKRPIFCVSALGDEIIQFAELSNLLGEDQPFYGLQQGLERTDKIRTTIPEIAAHYLSEIKTIQPEGPYLLAGYCFGGLVAYEMAQQLKAQGETVSPLLMIEAEAPGGIYPIKKSIAAKALRALRNLRENGLVAELSYLRKRLYKIWRWQIWTTVRHYLHRGIEKTGQELPAGLKDILQINARAADEYEPVIQPYTGDIYLLRAELMAPDYHYKEILGWDEIIDGEIRTHWLPGDHEGIWKTPNVQTYAKIMQDILAKYNPDHLPNIEKPEATPTQ